MISYEKSCGAVVYMIHDGRLRVLAEHMVQGHVSLPKGHMEGDETEAETAIREIREETNLDVVLDTGFRHEVCYSPKKDVLKTVVFFVAEAADISQERPQVCEVNSIEWMDIDQAISAMTYETDREVLRHAEAYIRNR